MVTSNDMRTSSVSCSRLRERPPPLAAFPDTRLQFPQPSPESVLLRGGVGRHVALYMRVLHAGSRARRNDRSVANAVDPALVEGPAAREAFRSVTTLAFAPSANAVLRSARAMHAPAPNPRFEGSRCRRGCFSFSARRFRRRCGHAPQPCRRARWRARQSRSIAPRALLHRAPGASPRFPARWARCVRRRRRPASSCCG